jgi:hypothetical protein
MLSLVNPPPTPFQDQMADIVCLRVDRLPWDDPVEEFIGSVTERKGYREALRWLTM